jgi:hypothetical protein
LSHHQAFQRKNPMYWNFGRLDDNSIESKHVAIRIFRVINCCFTEIYTLYELDTHIGMTNIKLSCFPRHADSELSLAVWKMIPLARKNFHVFEICFSVKKLVHISILWI